MNSALKPVLPTPGVAQPGGQASPAKANVANANHAVGHPQGAQNSLHHGTNNLVGQNLTHHAPAPPPPAHPVPSMAPVSANMAQMAQNMSHHGNLSHVTQNSVAPAVSPNKSASTSSPLSLVADKPVALALTRTPEKKDEVPGPANGTIESPKSASNAPTTLKAQNPEPNKEKQDIAKTSPSTPKPPEKPTTAPTCAPATPQKVEPAVPVSSADGPSQPKVATANEAPEKSPSKPAKPKPAPTADVAPTQSDSKPVPESANDSQLQDKPAASTPKPETNAETPATAKGGTPKPEEKKEEPAPEKSLQNSTEENKEKSEVKEDKTDKKEENQEQKEEVKSEPTKPEEPVVKEAEEAPKVEETKAEDKKPETKAEEKKPETKAAPKQAKATPKSTMKLATVTPPMRKRRHTSPKVEGPSPAKKPATESTPATPDSRMKRNRTQVQLYQSPTPELTMATKLSASAGRQTPTKPGDDKLIVFYKNEYLAVRNAEGSFYVCQAMQNVYRTTRKIKIRWLSQDKSDPTGETYKPDFYDVTDMECVLTTLSLSRAPAGGGAQLLKPAEEARAKSILQRALKAEQGDSKPEVTEEHPDGLDLSLYTDESQLEKGTRKRAARSETRRAAATTPQKEAAPPAKRARTTPKRSPKSARKDKLTHKQNDKRKPAGSTPPAAPSGKTAAVLDKSNNKGKSPAKRTPPARAKPAKKTPPAPPPAPSPARKGRRSAAKVEASPPAPVPSTSTGKTTRTPRKPPQNK